MASSNARIVVEVVGHDAQDLGQKIEAIDVIARTTTTMSPLDDLSDEPSPPVPSAIDPVAPFFDIGNATGKPGDIVELPVYGGCRFPMTGFHIGGGVGFLSDLGRSGYGKFKAVGVRLGDFLQLYLKEEDLIHDKPNHQHDHFWANFNFYEWGVGVDDPLPEEWWEYALGFFSLEGVQAPATTIPAGTVIFWLRIQILVDTAPGFSYEVTCRDEWFYTQGRHRRRDFLYSGAPSGGYTKLDLQPGKIIVEYENKIVTA